MDFNIFKQAVARQWERLQATGAMYRVKIDERNELVDLYLASFPRGTNPVYRKRTEYDCACCRQFIRSVGNCVAVIDGKLESVWDVMLATDTPFQVVADTLSAHVKSKPLADVFLSETKTAGTDKNFEEIVGEAPRQWNHFFVNIKPQFVASKGVIPSKLGEERTKVETFKRALETITLDSIDTVLDLIAQNSLYKGEENLFAVDSFRKAKAQWLKYLSHDYAALHCWTEAAKLPGSVTGIRNTAIGSLLVDLSEGMALDDAVKKFEFKVAPANYKRTTALVTPKMIEQAKEKIVELGLLSALDRRLAKLPDITVNNVLWADRSAKAAMGGDVFDTLAQQTSAKAKVSDKIEEVPIAKFLADILPKATSLEVLLDNKHTGNLVSLIAPQDATAGRLFKWDNNFSWSYNGEVTDSIKERVKQAGGNVTGDLCCRLAWQRDDDLDLHLLTPRGEHINYMQPSGQGVQLDVDANGRNGVRPNPVENIFYSSRTAMAEGRYTLYVNQYGQRPTYRGGEPQDGFEAEIDYMGEVLRFSHPKRLRNQGSMRIAVFDYTRKDGLKIVESMPSTSVSKNVWGLPTQTFHRANVVCLSPNYWDEQGVGNKHFFFMLEGCKNDGSVRGFYNEFLDSRLDPHRKVFEVLAGKTKPAITDEQLSGLGFSSTQRNTLTVRVKGSFTRVINVAF